MKDQITAEAQRAVKDQITAKSQRAQREGIYRFAMEFITNQLGDLGVLSVAGGEKNVLCVLSKACGEQKNE